jgi:AcrR family transcriptional regulator
MELWGKPTPLDPFSDFEWGNLDNPTERRLALVKAARAVVEDIQRHREGEEYLRDCFMRHMDNRHPDSSWDRTAMYEELGAGGRKVRTVWTKNRAGTYDVSEKKIYTPRFTVILLSKKLGISRSTFYRWFPKWKKLLRAVWGEIKDEEDGRTNEIP